MGLIISPLGSARTMGNLDFVLFGCFFESLCGFEVRSCHGVVARRELRYWDETEGREGANVVIRAGVLPLIVEILRLSTSKVRREYCVSLLLALCVKGRGDVVHVLVENTSLIGPLYALLTEGNSRASKKASSLIRLLHEFHERTCSRSSVAPAFPSGQFVHVW